MKTRDSNDRCCDQTTSGARPATAASCPCLCLDRCDCESTCGCGDDGRCARSLSR